MIHDAALARRLSDLFDGARVDTLERLSGGASRETWLFTIGGEELILQRLRRGAVTRIDLELRAITLAALSGVPVPQVVVDGSRSDALERPFLVVRRIRGESIARKILRDEPFARARAVLPEQLASAATRIHSTPIGELSELGHQDQVESMRALLDALGDPHPAFEIALRWLELHRPIPRSQVLVHGDFRLGNLLVDENGLTGVLDWELSHLGNPVEDLGWMCVRAWRFGSPLAAGGLCTREELLSHYNLLSDAPRVTLEELRWWEVLGTLKWGLICIMQAQTHLHGLVNSHELAILGRRVSENEWDVLGLLAGAMA